MQVRVSKSLLVGFNQLRASEIARRRTSTNCASVASTSPSGELCGGGGRGVLSSASDDDGGGFPMFAPPICRRRWRNNAFPFRQIRRRRRLPSEHRSERQRAIKQSAMREQLKRAPSPRHAAAEIAVGRSSISIRTGMVLCSFFSRRALVGPILPIGRFMRRLISQ